MATPNFAVPPPTPPPPPLPLRTLVHFVVLCVAIFPAICLMRLVGISSANDTTSEFLTSNGLQGPNIVESQYRLLFTVEASRRRRLNAALASFVSLIATLVLPFLRSSSFLGSPLYYWSLLATVLFCGRYLLDTAIAASIAALEPCRNKRWSYYASNVSQPLGSLLHTTLVFLTWQLLHFATVLYPVTGYGAWVVGAWMVRCGVILLNEAMKARWRANAVYDRFEDRILRVGFQVHILCSLIPSSAPDMSFMLAPWRKKESPVMAIEVADMCCKVEDHIRYFSAYKVTTKDVEAIAKCVEGFTSFLPADWGFSVGEVIRDAQGIAHDDGMHVDKRWLKEKLRLEDEDARVVYGELCALVNSPDDVSYSTFSAWMDKSHKENQETGLTLRVEEETIINSDRFLVAALISKAFLAWLFLTGKTTTQVAVVIPFVYLAKCFIDELSLPHFRSLLA